MCRGSGGQRGPCGWLRRVAPPVSCTRAASVSLSLSPPAPSRLGITCSRRLRARPWQPAWPGSGCCSHMLAPGPRAAPALPAPGTPACSRAGTAKLSPGWPRACTAAGACKAPLPPPANLCPRLCQQSHASSHAALTFHVNDGQHGAGHGLSPLVLGDAGVHAGIFLLAVPDPEGAILLPTWGQQLLISVPAEAGPGVAHCHHPKPDVAAGADRCVLQLPCKKRCRQASWALLGCPWLRCDLGALRGDAGARRGCPGLPTGPSRAATSLRSVHGLQLAHPRPRPPLPQAGSAVPLFSPCLQPGGAGCLPGVPGQRWPPGPGAVRFGASPPPAAAPKVAAPWANERLFLGGGSGCCLPSRRSPSARCSAAPTPHAPLRPRACPAPRHLLLRRPGCESLGCRPLAEPSRCWGRGVPPLARPVPSRTAPGELRSLCPLSRSGSCL